MKSKFLIGVAAFTMASLIGCQQQQTDSTQKTENKDMKYVITGKVSPDVKVMPDSIFVYNDAGGKINATIVKDGKFEMVGSVTEPEEVMIGYKVKDFYLLSETILENSTYVLDILPEEVVIKGGKIYDKLHAFINNPEYQKLEKEFEEFNANFKEEWMEDEVKLTAFRSKLEPLEQKMGEIQMKHFSEILASNEDAETKLFALLRNYDTETYTVEKRLALLDQFEKELGKRKLITDSRNRILENEKLKEVQAQIVNGSKYLDVEATDQKGKTIKLSDVVSKNKFTILEFWASWCGPCRAEIPHLKKAYAKYKGKGLEIYSLSLDQSNKAWITALKEENTPWLNVIDPLHFDGETAKKYGIEGVPASFMIDNSGKIVAQNDELREFELDRTLAKFLK